MNLESSSSSYALTKQDSLPRQPLRGYSPERLCTIRTNSNGQNNGMSRGTSLSDLSSSFDERSCCSESVSSIWSYDDGYFTTASSMTGTRTTSTSSIDSSLTSRQFSTTSCLSLFSSHRSERRKKYRARRMKQLQQQQQQQQQQQRLEEDNRDKAINRWDSWKECVPHSSPIKPERKGMNSLALHCVPLPPPLIVSESRWSSHSSSSSSTLMTSPKRSSSPRRISCSMTTTPMVTTLLLPQQEQKEDIVFHPQSTSSTSSKSSSSVASPTVTSLPQQLCSNRAVLTRRPKARNLLLEAAVTTTTTLSTTMTIRSYPIINGKQPPQPQQQRQRLQTKSMTEQDHATIQKLKSTWGSKRSIGTTSTRDSAASSTASPDYSIPWFSSSMPATSSTWPYRPDVLKKK